MKIGKCIKFFLVIRMNKSQQEKILRKKKTMFFLYIRKAQHIRKHTV